MCVYIYVCILCMYGMYVCIYNNKVSVSTRARSDIISFYSWNARPYLFNATPHSSIDLY